MLKHLNNVIVLITRPHRKALDLYSLVTEVGARGIVFPVIEIAPIDDNSQIFGQLNRLNDYDLAIFVSVHAVEYLSLLLKNQSKSWPSSVAIAAIGSTTSSSLCSAGFKVNIEPTQDFTTEGLLQELDNIELCNQKILIIRGQGGRETLANNLRQRGAIVDYLQVYQRRMPANYDSSVLSDWQPNNSVIVCTSNTGISNLLQMADQSNLLLQTPIIVVSERMRKFAQKSGFKNRVLVAKNAANESIIDALIKMF